MTKDQFIALIEANFNTGQLNFITGNKVYNSLYQLCDMVFGSAGTGRYRGICNTNTNPGTPEYGDFYFAAYNASSSQVFLNFSLTVNAGELCIFRYTTQWIKSVIGTILPGQGSEQLSASEIRDLLHTLSGTDRLHKSYVQGADFSLNRRAKGDILNATFKSGMTNIIAGDFWIYQPAVAPNPSDNLTIYPGDWVIALQSQSGPSYNLDYSSSAYWQIVNFGQSTIKHFRAINPSTSATFQIPEIEADIIQLSLNKETYYGIPSNQEGYQGYDFTYYHQNGNTVISLNPSLYPDGFTENMVVDVLYKIPLVIIEQEILPSPVYIGYLSSGQGSTITESVANGTTYPLQVSIIDTSNNHEDFPDTIDLYWKNTFNAMEEFSSYTQFLAIPVDNIPSEFAYYQNIDFIASKGAYSSKGTIETLSIDGVIYKIFKLNPTAPLNYRLSVNPL